jgi:hypothetical protein
MKVPTFFSRTGVPAHVQAGDTDGSTDTPLVTTAPPVVPRVAKGTTGAIDTDGTTEATRHNATVDAVLLHKQFAVYRDEVQLAPTMPNGTTGANGSHGTVGQDMDGEPMVGEAADDDEAAEADANAEAVEPLEPTVPPDDLAALLARLRHDHVPLVNLLLSIAWLGEVHSRQVRWAWMPTYTDRSARRVLQHLAHDGLIQSRWFYRRRRNRRKPPLRQGKLWSLTPVGMQLVGLLPNAPLRTIKLRSLGVANHDTITVEIVLRLVALARCAGLSGVYLDREVMLNPPARRPTMDGVIALRTTGTPMASLEIPWTTDPPTTGERARKYAIENDRMSEEISVIIGKAYAYQHAATPEWVARNGQFPIPLWVVPNDKRKDDIMKAWRTAWPHGKWLITTDADLAHDRWVEYRNGHERQRRLFALPADA